MKNVFKSIVVALLIQESKIILKRHRPTIVAITGSVGKTTTKDAIYAAIKNSISARKSEKSFNSDIGVPLTILGLSNAWNNPFLWIKNLIDGLFIALFSKKYPAVLVLETGIDRPGDMEKLTRWLTPDVVVLTRLPNVPVHVEYFSSPQAVVEEKMKLVTALKAEGTLIYNNDDPIIQAQLPGVLQRTVGYSRYLTSDFTAHNDRIVYADDLPVGTQFDLQCAGQTHIVKVDGAIGVATVYTAAAAIAVATVLGVSAEEAVVSVSTVRTPNGRMRLIPGIKATTIIDDTYNASPAACEQAIATLQEVKYAKRKFAVLGDMLELGRFSSEEHEKIGAQVVQAADVLLTVGVRARKIAEGALEHGMPEENILQYDDVERAGRELQAMLQPGDVVLVKASQGIRAEKIVEEVMAEPEKASDLLVRQDEQWKRR